MSLYITSLNSGSNGNCYYVGNDTDAVLIDAGISCRETEKRMKKLGLDIRKVKAVFISHEHGDHVKGLSTLANKYKLPVFITSKTAAGGPHLIKHLSKSFTAGKPIAIGELIVTAFAKYHDAADPHSFIISYKGTTVAVMTDLGKVCSQVAHYFKQCHAVFLEANYDSNMLENGKYPLYLKKRIRGGLGHLSNDEALKLFTTHRSPFLSHVILSHLSEQNNSPEIVSALFAPHANKTKIVIASRHTCTDVFLINSMQQKDKKTAMAYEKPSQLQLF